MNMEELRNHPGAAINQNLPDTTVEQPDTTVEQPDTTVEQPEQDRAGRCCPKGTRFASLIRPISEDPRCQDMKQYIQHGKITTYDHCMDVAKTSYKLGAALRMKVHEKELVRGAFLHDYFLYDWHHHDKPWHGYTHPSTAAENADRDFDATPLEREIIRSHMWPLTLRTLPKSREAVLVCIADKICSLKETLFHR